ncbi:MAG TPA: methyltransferase domain-containing protein [Herpetosiphonaceae bacterium]
MLTPPRSTEPELLDAHPAADGRLAANLREMALLHRWTGGAALIWRALLELAAGERGPLVVLELAAGDGSLGRWLAAAARQRGLALELIASDLQPAVAGICRDQAPGTPTLVCDGLRLPFADQAADLVMCAQTLHHLEPAAVAGLLGEAGRVARLGWVMTDLRRSWPGYWGARLAALGPMTDLGRHDGPLSVLRAYTPGEMGRMVASAGLAGVALRRSLVHYGLVWRRPAGERLERGRR